MRKTALAIAGALLAFPATAATVADVTSCQPTLERWIGANGDKFPNGYEQWGALLSGTIRWDNGVVAEVFVGPHRGQFCVLASRYIGREQRQAAE